jgi:hypothetical protein
VLSPVKPKPSGSARDALVATDGVEAVVKLAWWSTKFGEGVPDEDAVMELVDHEQPAAADREGARRLEALLEVQVDVGRWSAEEHLPSVVVRWSAIAVSLIGVTLCLKRRAPRG